MLRPLVVVMKIAPRRRAEPSRSKKIRLLGEVLGDRIHDEIGFPIDATKVTGHLDLSALLCRPADIAFHPQFQVRQDEPNRRSLPLARTHRSVW